MGLFLCAHVILFIIALVVNPCDMLDLGVIWGIFCPGLGTGCFIYTIINAICSIFDKYKLGNYNFDSICKQAATGKIDVTSIVGTEPPYNPFSLSYEQFIKFYLINPEKWSLKAKNYLLYLPKGADADNNECYVASFYSGKEYKKAVKYYLDCQENEKKNNPIFTADCAVRKNTVEVLKDIQQDIDKLRARADSEIIEANIKAQEINSKLNN